MSECTKFQELISSAVDNEISDADKEALEAHLAECEACRRVYEAFSAISGAAADSLAEVPKNFKENTMSLVMSEASRPKGVKRFLNLYGRYTALAAVLAVIIIGGKSVTGNMFRMGNSAPPPAADTASAEAVMDGGDPSMPSSRGNANSIAAENKLVELDEAAEADNDMETAPAAAGAEYDYVTSENSYKPSFEEPSFVDSNAVKSPLSHEDLGYERSFCAICTIEGVLPSQLAELDPIRSEGGETHYEISVELFYELDAEGAFSSIFYEDGTAETALVIYTAEP